MAGVALGGQHAEAEDDVVAVRADQRDPPLDLLVPPGRHRVAQRLRQLVAAQPALEVDRGLVLRGRLVVGGGDVGVGLRHVRAEVGERAEPGGQQLTAGRGQVGVPDLEGRRGLGRRRTAAAAPAEGLEQGVALPQHPVVVGPDAGHPRPAGDQQVVEEPATLPRVALDDGEVLGGEDDGAQHPDQLARTAQRGAVQLGPVGLARGDLDLELELARVVDAGLHPGPDDRPLGAEADERLVGGDPVRAQRGQVLDGLDEVGLALAVGPDEGRDPRAERHVDAGVGAEVGQLRDGRRTRGKTNGLGTDRRPLDPSALRRAQGAWWRAAHRNQAPGPRAAGVRRSPWTRSSSTGDDEAGGSERGPRPSGARAD